MRHLFIACALIATGVGIAGTAAAQSPYDGGNDWSRSWGFPSVGEASVALQRAQAVRNARRDPGPATVIYNRTDNRANYIESTSTSGEITADLNVGDKIGTNTNAVGAMNTGNTEVTIDGQGNTVGVDNWADNHGCTDGSVTTSSGGTSPDVSVSAGGPLGPFAQMQAAMPGADGLAC